MAPVSNNVDDAATEALIARLIAEDLGENIDSLRIGGSVEDYEEPLSSFERGVIDGTISNVPSWGDPVSDTSASGYSSTVINIPDYTGEGCDDSCAWDEPACANTSEPEKETQEQYDNNTDQLPNAEWCILAQTSIVPIRELALPVSDHGTSNANNPLTHTQQRYSNVLPRPFTPPTMDSSLPDTVPNSPVLGPHREPPNSSHSEAHRVPSPLILDRPSSPFQAPVSHPETEVSNHPRSELNVPSDTSKPLMHVRLSEDAVGRAITWPKSTQRHPRNFSAESVLRRLSAADRYAGLDIDYSSSKGKGKARAFDRIPMDEANDFDSNEEYAGFSQIYQKYEEKLRDSAGLLDDWHDSEGDKSPLIYIPFPGLALGRDEQEIICLEDMAVVEIHVGEDETLESILNDICNPSDRQARERLEASVASGAPSTVGTQGSKDTTSAEASSVVGTDGFTNFTSLKSPDRGRRDRAGLTGLHNEPQMWSHRGARRIAYDRQRRHWLPKRNDPELLHSKEMPKAADGEEIKGGEALLRKKPPRKGTLEAKKGKREDKEMGESEVFRGRTMEKEALPLREKPVEGPNEVEAQSEQPVESLQ